MLDWIELRVIISEKVIKQKHVDFCFQLAKEAKKIPNPLKRALKDAVEFNAQLAQQRREERCSYFDMQTQVPK